MALILSESFATGIPSGFATIVVDGSTFTATHQSSQQAVDLAITGNNGAWRIDASPNSLDMRIVLDVEQLVADAGGTGDSGIGVLFKAASETVSHLLLLSTEAVRIARYRGAFGTPSPGYVDEDSVPWPLPSLAGRRTLEFTCVRAGDRRQYQIRVDGVLLYFAPIDVGPTTDLLQPSIWLRDSSYRLHEISIYDDATALPLTGRLAGENIRLPPRTWAPAGYRIAGQTLRYDSAFGGRMRLAGFTEVDGTPPTRVGPRRVLILDQLTGRLVRETWSDSAGAWEVTNLANAKYLVITPDPTLTYDPAALSDVVPASMP